MADSHVTILRNADADAAGTNVPRLRGFGRHPGRHARPPPV